MKRKLSKRIFNFLFLVVVFGFTLWVVFRDQDLDQVLSYMQTANMGWILPSIACVVLFIMGEAVLIYYLMRTLGTKVRLSRCWLYSCIGFFYSALTPSASGGQPMQIYYMRKDKIPVAVSLVVLAIIAVTYKLVLVIIGLAVMLLRPAALMVYLEPVESIIWVGLGLNIVFVALLLLAIFKPNTIRILCKGILNLVNKIHPFKNRKRLDDRVERILSQYEGTSDFFKNHLRVIGHVMIVTFIQRIILFLVTWLTYKSFALRGHSLPVITTLQGMISVATDMLPLPGGMGISETLFLEIFQPIFGENLIVPGMVISRGISYYTQALLSAVMTIAAAFIIKEKKTER